MVPIVPTYAFTSASTSGVLSQLKNQVSVSNGDSAVNAIALWDTGATITCISSDVVSSLGLVPTGKRNIQTPTGRGTVNTYLVSIVLPDDVNIADVEVCDSAIGDQGIGVLIGMDIITKGDFSVSNYRNQTVFSFRIPSRGKTDYVAQLKIEKIKGTHGSKKKNKK